jgi:hypothetical protein
MTGGQAGSMPPRPRAVEPVGSPCECTDPSGRPCRRRAVATVTHAGWPVKACRICSRRLAIGASRRPVDVPGGPQDAA